MPGIDIFEVFDQFAQPVRWKYRLPNKALKSYFYGTYTGIIFTIIGMVFLFLYIGFLNEQITNHKND